MRAVTSHRSHPLAVALSILALLGQLLLPTVHAQSAAQRSGDPLLYAFCGQVTAQVAETLRAQLDASPAAQGGDHGDRDAALASLSCPACAGLQAAQLPASVPAGPVLHRAALPRAERSISQTLVDDTQLRLPPAQAPPSLS